MPMTKNDSDPTSSPTASPIPTLQQPSRFRRGDRVSVHNLPEHEGDTGEVLYAATRRLLVDISDQPVPLVALAPDFYYVRLARDPLHQTEVPALCLRLEGLA